MSVVRAPGFTIWYNKKDITADISPYLISITYNDAVAGKSDEVQLEISNATGIWLDEWYPDLGDTLTVSMGYDAQRFNCGIFEIDENEVEFGPDTITIKGIAAGITDATRTKRSDQHENKTLRQIAEKVAARYSFKIAGNIEDTGQISRETQELETDLGFLRRISAQYGHIFSVRGKVITFTNMYELEALAAVVSISRAEIRPGSKIKDKSFDIYKKVHHAHFDPMSKKVYETIFEFPEIVNVDGFKYNGIVKKDIKEVRSRVDNNSQSMAKAIAALHSGNSKQQEGELSLPGNPFLVSGNNFELTECGKLSGKYHIVSSRHKLNVSGGYDTTIAIKRVGFIDIIKTKRSKPKKVKPIHTRIVQ